MGELLQIEESGIRDHAELKRRIVKLTGRKAEQEAEIKRNIRDLYYSLRPEYMMTTIRDRVSGPGWKSDLRRLGLSLGADYFSGRIFKRHLSLKGFIFSVIFNKIVVQLIRESDMLKTGLKKLRSKFKKSS
jgi:hypothetical protein